MPEIEGAYVVVTHSGTTPVPILGRCLAQKIMEKGSAPLLIFYRSNRYITSSSKRQLLAVQPRQVKAA